MPPHKHAPKPVTDTSVQSAGKVLQTRPFQPDVNMNQQAPQLQDEPAALTGGFDLTKIQYDFSPPTLPLGRPLQAKLAIGEPNDKYEQEADRVAHDVVQRSPDQAGGDNPSSSDSKEDVSLRDLIRDLNRPVRSQFNQPPMPPITGGFDLTKKVLESGPPLSPSYGLPLQAKLTIGAPNDKYEQEADRVAKQVVQRLSFSSGKPSAKDPGQPPQPNQTLQREVEPEEEDELQMKPLLQRSGSGAVAASDDLESAIQQSRGSGQPLADSSREPMEQAFGGVDFRGVKVHTDGRSDQLNRSIQAKAFTTGQDIFFRQGAYQPGSRGGQELIAHELTHVVQQNVHPVQKKTNGSFLKTIRQANSAIQRVKDSDIEIRLKGSIKPGTDVYDTQDNKAGTFDKETFYEFERQDGNKLWFNNGQVYVTTNHVELDKFVKIDKNVPLFQKEPKPEDVKQGDLGDCWLLAAVASIVEKNPQKIKSIMHDQGETVIVDLYQVQLANSQDEDSQRTYKQIQVEVQKSVVKRKDVGQMTQGDAYAKDALWVQILEKAFVASKIDSIKPFLLKGTASYKEMHEKGGNPAAAFEVLLGSGASGYFIVGSEQDPEKMPWPDFMSGSSQQNQKKVETIANDIFGQNQQKVKAFMQFITTKNHLNNTPIMDLLNARTANSYDREFRMKHFKEMFDNGLGSSLAAEVMIWMEKKEYFPGNRGEGKYSAEQKKAFIQIKDGLDKGRPVTLKTKDKVVNPTKYPTTTGSGGEQVGGGMVGGHFYSVHEYAENVQGTSVIRIKVRNPWGKYSIVKPIRTGQKRIEDEGTGEFWLDLSDITKYFKSVIVG